MFYAVISSFVILLSNLIKDKKIYFIFVYTLMAVISGIRAPHVGTDTANYIYLYHYWQRWEFLYLFDGIHKGPEPGSLLLIKMVSLITDEAQVYLMVVSLLTYAFLGMFIYKNVEKYYGLATFLIITLGFFAYQLNAMRQALAIAIACHMFKPIVEGKIIRGIFITLLASMFHYSLLVLLPVIVLVSFIQRFIKNEGKNLHLMIVLSVLILLILLAGYSFLMNHLEMLGGTYLIYFSPDSKYNATRGVGSIRLAFCFGLVVISMWLNSFKVDEFTRKKYFFTTILVMCAIFMTLGQANAVGIFYRLIDTFNIFVCLLLPYAIARIKSKYNRWWTMFIFFFFGELNLLYQVYSGINGVKDYSVFFM